MSFADELTKVTPFSAPGRILNVADTPEKILETCYLTCLSRRPTPPEQAYFLPLLKEKEGLGEAIQDLYWVLFNSPEFSWNH